MSLPNVTIHTGFWTNYSKGSIAGSTLTLTNRNGGILIAALAIFIQLLGGQSWGIIRFITHQLRTTTKARDCLHYQQQATLRNFNSDISTIFEFTRIGYTWRSRIPGSFRKSITLICIGTLHLIAFGAASILASHIITTDNEVLITRSPRCGPWNTTNGVTDSEENLLQLSYGSMRIKSSGQYVQSCLGGSLSLPECNMFKSSQLNWTSTTNNPCPFGDLCLGPANSSLYLDTGLVDSRDDFGINSKDKDRIQWRKNATCIPITTDGYSKQGTSSVEYYDVHYKGDNTFNYTALFYGTPLVANSVLGISDPNLTNATYIHTNWVDIVMRNHNQIIGSYDLEMDIVDQGGTFVPIPDLSIPNATVTLAYATFFGAYTGPSDDLWLSAHQQRTETYSTYDGNTIEVTLYGQDKEVGVLACIEQQQLCNPFPLANSTSNCTRWQPMYHDFEDQELKGVFNNDHQLAAVTAILIQAGGSALNYAVTQIPLLAENYGYDMQALPVASNQWVLEVENWFTTGLANMQYALEDFITGPPAPYTEFIPLNQADNDTNLAWICESQIVRRSNYTNFRTMPIFLIFALGFVLYVVNQTLESVVGWYRTRRRGGQWRQRAWCADGTLQLQRRAFEGIGIKNWEPNEWDKVPVLQKGRSFDSFRNWDEMPPQTPKEKIPVVQRKESSVSEAPDPKKRKTVVHVDSISSSES